jgi:hypothetical protein
MARRDGYVCLFFNLFYLTGQNARKKSGAGGMEFAKLQVPEAFFPKPGHILLSGRSSDLPRLRKPSRLYLGGIASGVFSVSCSCELRLTAAGTVPDFHGIPF